MIHNPNIRSFLLNSGFSCINDEGIIYQYRVMDKNLLLVCNLITRKMTATFPDKKFNMSNTLSKKNITVNFRWDQEDENVTIEHMQKFFEKVKNLLEDTSL